VARSRVIASVPLRSSVDGLGRLVGRVECSSAFRAPLGDIGFRNNPWVQKKGEKDPVLVNLSPNDIHTRITQPPAHIASGPSPPPPPPLSTPNHPSTHLKGRERIGTIAALCRILQAKENVTRVIDRAALDDVERHVDRRKARKRAKFADACGNDPTGRVL
jgi:hypothetical protein